MILILATVLSLVVTQIASRATTNPPNVITVDDDTSLKENPEEKFEGKPGEKTNDMPGLEQKCLPKKKPEIIATTAATTVFSSTTTTASTVPRNATRIRIVPDWNAPGSLVGFMRSCTRLEVLISLTASMVIALRRPFALASVNHHKFCNKQDFTSCFSTSSLYNGNDVQSAENELKIEVPQIATCLCTAEASMHDSKRIFIVHP
ncbi:unnamed protein product [Gongylonema pulchrum]|uniref:Secreted protein n=1 Tax=Gongylonema pulchrum TaxID=637853 RepID=A0A183DNV1_9BILA|nr:unnamed protein product [Gongylonema pulchrum]